MKTAGAIVLAALLALSAGTLLGQDEPKLVPDVVEYQKLLPLLPGAPEGWTADEPEGSTEDVGGFRLTNVHRDYRKGDGDKAPSAAISILDSVSNPDYVTATTQNWNRTSETPDGYAKSVKIDGHPGFESYDKEQKNVSLWVMVADRYFVQVELRNLEPKELPDWIKRVDLKKLATIK